MSVNQRATRPAMSLQDLLPGSETPAVTVTGLTEDSRAVVAGDAFVAVRGAAADGHHHIGEAAANGAVVVLCERLVVDGR